MNIEILGAMLTQACHHNSFPYVLHLMDNCINEGIDPSQKFMDNLETFRKKSKHISNDSVCSFKCKKHLKVIELFVE